MQKDDKIVFFFDTTEREIDLEHLQDSGLIREVLAQQSEKVEETKLFFFSLSNNTTFSNQS